MTKLDPLPVYNLQICYFEFFFQLVMACQNNHVRNFPSIAEFLFKSFRGVSQLNWQSSE